mmetsp:Transcript_89073/g.157826  ORF Transcript_89073/g.157826 Transcript_89073/m.157826 type:complete len:215 (-) Transcript_89073:312-956(-)
MARPMQQGPQEAQKAALFPAILAKPAPSSSFEALFSREAPVAPLRVLSMNRCLELCTSYEDCPLKKLLTEMGNAKAHLCPSLSHLALQVVDVSAANPGAVYEELMRPCATGRSPARGASVFPRDPRAESLPAALDFATAFEAAVRHPNVHKLLPAAVDSQPAALAREARDAASLPPAAPSHPPPAPWPVRPLPAPDQWHGLCLQAPAGAVRFEP